MICLSNSESGIRRLLRFTQTRQCRATFDSQTQCRETEFTEKATGVWTTKSAFSTHNGKYRRTVFSKCDCETRLSPYTTFYRNAIATKIGRKPTHYEVLGLQKDASADDIRSAFLQKSKECHPDLNSKNPNNHTQFVSVNEAYSVLSKPMERRNYDIFLNNQEVLRSSPRTPSMANDPYYYSPKGYYHEQIYYKGQPYYEIRRLRKISNLKVVAGCMLLMLVGVILNISVVREFRNRHTKHLNVREAQAHEMWMKSKKEAEAYSALTREQRSEMLRERLSK